MRVADGGDQTPAAQLHAQIMRFVRILKSASSITPDQSALLLLWPLLHEGPMRLRDLAQRKGVDASVVSRQVAQLVRDGLVRRDPDLDDRRATLLAPTDAGRQFCGKLMHSRQQRIEDALADWPAGKIRQLATLLGEFTLALEAHQRADEPTHIEAPGGARTGENE